MLGLRFAQPSSARNGSESRACGGRRLRKPSKTVIVHLLLRKRRNEVSGDRRFWCRLSPLKKAEIAAMRSLRYRSDFRCAAIQSSVVWRTECRRECNRIRGAPQPLTRCRDTRLRCGWKRDRDARAQGRFQGVVIGLAISPPFKGRFPRWIQK